MPRFWGFRSGQTRATRGSEFRFRGSAKHPVIKLAEKTGIGFELHFLDSEISNTVIFVLMPQWIVTLSVHDSFLVRLEFLPQLCGAMLKVFEEVLGSTAKLIPEELPVDGFGYLTKNRLKWTNSWMSTFGAQPLSKLGVPDLACILFRSSGGCINLFSFLKDGNVTKLTHK